MVKGSDAKLSRLINWFQKNRQTKEHGSHEFTHSGVIVIKDGEYTVAEMQGNGLNIEIPWSEYLRYANGEVWRMLTPMRHDVKVLRQWVHDMEGNTPYNFLRLVGVSTRLGLIGKVSPGLERWMIRNSKLARMSSKPVCSDFTNVVMRQVFGKGVNHHITPAYQRDMLIDFEKQGLAKKVGEF